MEYQRCNSWLAGAELLDVGNAENLDEKRRLYYSQLFKLHEFVAASYTLELCVQVGLCDGWAEKCD